MDNTYYICSHSSLVSVCRHFVGTVLNNSVCASYCSPCREQKKSALVKIQSLLLSCQPLYDKSCFLLAVLIISTCIQRLETLTGMWNTSVDLDIDIIHCLNIRWLHQSPLNIVCFSQRLKIPDNSWCFPRLIE